MINAYAASVPHPRGNAMAQDFFQRRLIIGNTDYSIYSSLLTPIGIDMSFVDNGYIYHTYRFVKSDGPLVV